MKLHKAVKCVSCGGAGTVLKADTKAMRAKRTSKGLSVRGLAKKLKVSPPFLSDVELNRRPCPEWVLKAYEKL